MAIEDCSMAGAGVSPYPGLSNLLALKMPAGIHIAMAAAPSRSTSGSGNSDYVRFRHGHQLRASTNEFPNPLTIGERTPGGFLAGVAYFYAKGTVELAIVNGDDPSEGWTGETVEVAEGSDSAGYEEFHYALERANDYECAWHVVDDRATVAVELWGPRVQRAAGGYVPFGLSGLQLVLNRVSEDEATRTYALATGAQVNGLLEAAASYEGAEAVRRDSAGSVEHYVGPSDMPGPWMMPSGIHSQGWLFRSATDDEADSDSDAENQSIHSMVRSRAADRDEAHSASSGRV
jgi:hypothetical protein